MAETVAVETEVQDVSAEQPTEPTGDATGKEPTAEKTFTQADVDKIIAERLQRAKQQAEQATAKATAEAERKAAESQGQFKELYEKTLAEVEAERKARRTLELSTMKANVARSVGLPEKLAMRLQGEDEESLLMDAKSILAELPKPAAPNINSGAGNGNAPKAGVMDEAQKRELAAIYGVNAAYLN
jgi:F0F1-type ATP synthase membrane subunit b/b'